MTNVEKHIDILGKKVRDKVSLITGVATSVSFDLFGCVQVVINTGLDKDGNPKTYNWYDISRLEIVANKRVMDIPDFSTGLIAEGKKGASEKPTTGQAI
jgi:hypothetical protein